MPPEVEEAVREREQTPVRVPREDLEVLARRSGEEGDAGPEARRVEDRTVDEREEHGADHDGEHDLFEDAPAVRARAWPRIQRGPCHERRRGAQQEHRVGLVLRPDRHRGEDGERPEAPRLVP